MCSLSDCIFYESNVWIFIVSGLISGVYLVFRDLKGKKMNTDHKKLLKEMLRQVGITLFYVQSMEKEQALVILFPEMKKRVFGQAPKNVQELSGN